MTLARMVVRMVSRFSSSMTAAWSNNFHFGIKCQFLKSNGASELLVIAVWPMDSATITMLYVSLRARMVTKDNI